MNVFGHFHHTKKCNFFWLKSAYLAINVLLIFLPNCWPFLTLFVYFTLSWFFCFSVFLCHAVFVCQIKNTVRNNVHYLMLTPGKVNVLLEETKYEYFADTRMSRTKVGSLQLCLCSKLYHPRMKFVKTVGSRRSEFLSTLITIKKNF